jgi:hypothetical protein
MAMPSAIPARLNSSLPNTASTTGTPCTPRWVTVRGPERLTPGARVTGAYLGQPFSARIVGVQAITSAPGSYRVSLDLDEAVDVVTFDSFSSFRKRVNGVIGKEA